jgi:uncharacterized protein
MGFEWDEAKNLANQEKHGISFELASEIFDGVCVFKVDNRFDYAEERRLVLGCIENFILLVVYTPRKEMRRIISARLANKEERRVYYGIIERAAIKNPWQYERE